jgi:hypothetical protein
MSNPKTTYSAVTTRAAVDNRRIRVVAAWKLVPASVADRRRIRVGAAWTLLPKI